MSLKSLTALGEGGSDGGWAITTYGWDGYFPSEPDPTEPEPDSRGLWIDQFVGERSFVHRIEIRNVHLEDLTGDVFDLCSSEVIRISDRFGGADPSGIVRMFLYSSPRERPGQWGLVVQTGSGSSLRRTANWVPQGDCIAMELWYDHVSSEVRATYDNDVFDAVEPMQLRPLHFSGDYQQTHEIEIEFSAIDDGRANGLVDLWSTMPVSDVEGDFNGDTVLDVADIDLLSAEVRSELHERRFDLNADDRVDDADRERWIFELRQTHFGDANLDGQFNSSDLTEVFVAGQYEDLAAENSTWATGDWNGDGDFNSADLVVAFEDGSYVADPPANAVPEPVFSWIIFAIASVLLRNKFQYG